MNVLLVEDSAAVAAVLAMRLHDLGHAVDVAENGQLALDRFRRSCPDLVLMDLEMPVMNGVEATRQMREWEASQQWAWTPILFLTASATEQNLITAIEVGADDFIAKTASEPVLRAKMLAMSRIAALRGRLAAAHRELQALAHCDGLTGLANRRALDERSDIAWTDALRGKQAFGLLLLDLDNFKRFNDSYGHLAGDDCLRSVARILQGAARHCNEQGHASGAFAARYGGEEFAVILPDISATAHEGCAQAILRKLRDQAIEHQGNSPWGIATVSIGGCRLDAADGHIASLFRTSDSRLYAAKEAGRNRAHLS